MTRPIMPAPIIGNMPNGDKEDPPVSRLALDAARQIDALLLVEMAKPRAMRVSCFQLIIEKALNEALDRCQKLGGRRTRW